MEVASVMTAEPITVGVDGTLDEAMRLMDEHDVRHLPVMDGPRLAGVVSDRDLLEATGWLPARVRDIFKPPAAGDDHRRVREIMHTPAMTVSPEDSVVTVTVEAVVQGIGCLPVARDGVLLGIVTEMDLLTAYHGSAVQDNLVGDVDPPVERCMSTKPEALDANQTLDEAIEVTRKLGVRHLPVVGNGVVVGMLSDRDLRRAQGCRREGDYPVSELMTRPAVTVDPDTPLSRAAQRMTEHKFSALAVVRDDELVGMLTLTDMLDHCMNNLRNPE